jgi:hypothetical protein
VHVISVQNADVARWVLPLASSPRTSIVLVVSISTGLPNSTQHSAPYNTTLNLPTLSADLSLVITTLALPVQQSYTYAVTAVEIIGVPKISIDKSVSSSQDSDAGRY